MHSPRMQSPAYYYRLAVAPLAHTGSGTLVERLGCIVALIIQQGAFVSLPIIMSGVRGYDFRAIDNIWNAASVWGSIAFVLVVSLPRHRSILRLLYRNWLVSSFVVLAIISTAWSIHPDVTFKRAIGYLLTISLVAYMVVRFELIVSLRLLSTSLIISAISSLVFVLLWPQYGTMEGGNLEGVWRGVFTHKQVLSTVMAVAVFVETFLLVADPVRRPRRLAAIALYVFLIVQTGGAAASVVTLVTIVGAWLFLLHLRSRDLSVAVGISAFTGISVIAVLLLFETEYMLSLVGKDAGLTGRAQLWAIVIDLISKAPILGVGYRATWDPFDETTITVDYLTGNWSVTNSQNAFLEVTLQLGFVGLTFVLAMLAQSVYRARLCGRHGEPALGFFLALFVFIVCAVGMVEDTLAQNQNIYWLLFTLLLLYADPILLQARHVREMIMRSPELCSEHTAADFSRSNSDGHTR